MINRETERARLETVNRVEKHEQNDKSRDWKSVHVRVAGVTHNSNSAPLDFGRLWDMPVTRKYSVYNSLCVEITPTRSRNSDRPTRIVHKMAGTQVVTQKLAQKLVQKLAQKLAEKLAQKLVQKLAQKKPG
jgi:RNA 3'-terminal phosphate cyclase